MVSELSTQPSELGNSVRRLAVPFLRGIRWEIIIMERNMKYSWLHLL